MGLLGPVTEEQMRRASEVGRRAADDALRGLAESLSGLLGRAVDIYLEGTRGRVNRRFRVEDAQEPHQGYGKVYVDGRVFSLPG